MDKKLYTKEQIVEKINEEYGNKNVCIVSTEDYDLTTNPTWGNSKKIDVDGQILSFVNCIMIKTEMK